MKTQGVSLMEWARRRQELSATQLADRMGVSRSSVSQVERGFQSPSAAFKRKAAEALGVAVEDLWPMHFVLVRSAASTTELHTTAGLISAFTTQARARRAARGQERVAGPMPPDFFAAILGVSEAEVPGMLAIDPRPTDTNDGATPRKSRAVKTSDRAARNVSG